MAIPPPVWLSLFIFPAKVTQSAVGTSSAAFKNVDIECPDLRQEQRVTSLMLSQGSLPIRWRRDEPGHLPLVFVVRADNDMEVHLVANREVSSLVGEKVL